MLVISCHADTNYESCFLKRQESGVFEGFLDNFAGVYAVMQAYFSGRLTQDFLKLELTYGEEKDYEGAEGVLRNLRKHDMVIVVDVTGIETDKDFTIEKCKNEALREFLGETLKDMSFDIFPDCPDPVSDMDETDVYSRKCRYVCFLGIPCWGGDYNEEPVKCREKSIAAVSDAICRIAEGFSGFCERQKISSS